VGQVSIYLLRKDALEGENTLKKFRKENSLAGPSEYPDNRFGGWLIVLIFFLIESLANGYILGQVHQQAMIGAYGEAFLISLI